MNVDQSTHSLFGASKLSADIMVQEYGRYFGLQTVCFRAGCLTGGGQSGTELHGFLAYLIKCMVTGHEYTIYGYKGKQVRDNIHSYDLVSAMWEFFQAPKRGAVYNIGGSRLVNCSIIEAIDICERIAKKTLKVTYVENSRFADHIWWVTDISKFERDYPNFALSYDLTAIVEDIIERGSERWAEARD